MLWFSQTVLFIICTSTLDQDKITPFESVSQVITMCQTAFLKVKCVQIRFWMTDCMLWCHSANWRSDISVDAHNLLTSLWLYTLGCLPGKQGCNTKGNRMQINVDLRVGNNDTPLPMSKHQCLSIPVIVNLILKASPLKLVCWKCQWWCKCWIWVCVPRKEKSSYWLEINSISIFFH